jgi:hypothetical protein
VADVITASEPSWTAPFSGLSPRQSGKLVTALWREGADPMRKGRPWGLPLEDRVLLAPCWRTHLTLRQLAPLFGICKSAADRVIAHLGPSLALQPPQTIPQGRRPDRGRHPDPHPRPHGRLAVEELPVLDQPPGGHRRRHPSRRRCRPTAARQPQRLQGVGAVRREGRRRQDNSDRGRRLSGHRGLVIPLPPQTRRSRTAGLERGTQHLTGKSEPASSTSSPA